MVSIYNENCISGSKKHLEDKSIDLIICDPPFGIGEGSFDKHYNRKKNNVIDGYVEAPDDYYQFTTEWLSQATRVLKDNGSMYIISGWSNSDIIGRCIRELGLHLINKIIWKYSFGVYCKNKFVTSHYEIFYISKKKNSKITFNTDCRYDNTKEQYHDMESVWYILKEYQKKKEKKNKNKLPSELIKKMIQYSTNPNDIVCDFFLGNFTTAVSAVELDRVPCGFELNESMFLEKIKIFN